MYVSRSRTNQPFTNEPYLEPQDTDEDEEDEAEPLYTVSKLAGTERIHDDGVQFI